MAVHTDALSIMQQFKHVSILELLHIPKHVAVYTLLFYILVHTAQVEQQSSHISTLGQVILILSFILQDKKGTFSYIKE